MRFGTGKPDGEGGYDGSWINFRASILNKKNKSLIIEKIACELYSGSNRIAVCSCADKDTGRKCAGAYKYDELRYIDVASKSSTTKNIHVFVRGDLTSCDKVVFVYSWGIVKRKQIVWVKEDTPVIPNKGIDLSTVCLLTNISYPDVELNLYLKDRGKYLGYLRKARTVSRYLQDHYYDLGRARKYAISLKGELQKYGPY